MLKNNLKSLVIPVYKNEDNIPSLIQAIKALSGDLDHSLEVVFVIDGSPDNSKEVIKQSTEQVSFPYQIIELSKNFGAFTAIRTGFEYVSGQNVAVMAADLQEPISLIADLFDTLEKGHVDIAFGQRVSRADPVLRRFLSNSYWTLYRKFVLPDIPKGGVDIFAFNRKVLETILKMEEPNSSLVAQLFWVGYRRAFIPYERREREIGASSWSFRKRLRYMLDSIFSFSDAPLMLVFWVGFFSFSITAIGGTLTILGKLMGWIQVPGYAAVILSILFFGSSTILIQGIIGCYVWRTFENTKKRPLTVIQDRLAAGKTEMISDCITEDVEDHASPGSKK